MAESDMIVALAEAVPIGTSIDTPSGQIRITQEISREEFERRRLANIDEDMRTHGTVCRHDVVRADALELVRAGAFERVIEVPETLTYYYRAEWDFAAMLQQLRKASAL